MKRPPVSLYTHFELEFQVMLLFLLCLVQVSYREPTPPDVELIVRSQVVKVKESTHPGLGKSSVEVDVVVMQVNKRGGRGLFQVVRGGFGGL